uniref:Uncharacterized protein n=1 Tax=Anguilla anguilla TaxID=7936 RepID=A0A0E9SAU8_ANGAN
MRAEQKRLLGQLSEAETEKQKLRKPSAACRKTCALCAKSTRWNWSI